MKQAGITNICFSLGLIHCNSVSLKCMLKLLYNLETSIMICIIRVVFYTTKIALSLRGMIAREYVNTVVTSRFFAVRDEFTFFTHFLDC